MTVSLSLSHTADGLKEVTKIYARRSWRIISELSKVRFSCLQITTRLFFHFVCTFGKIPSSLSLRESAATEIKNIWNKSTRIIDSANTALGNTLAIFELLRGGFRPSLNDASHNICRFKLKTSA